jgi:hypothetical protein
VDAERRSGRIDPASSEIASPAIVATGFDPPSGRA